MSAWLFGLLPVVPVLAAPLIAPFREAETRRLYPPLGPLVDVEGRKVHAVTRGAGRDVVLVHGSSGNLRDFTFSLQDRLARNFRVTALDRPGLGWSDPLPPDASSIHDQARHLRVACARVGRHAANRAWPFLWRGSCLGLGA